MLRQGSVIRARVPDPQGDNVKVRPLVVVTPTTEISAQQTFVGVAITGSFSEPLAKDEVALPYHPSGTASSGLRKPCVAKCSWLVELNGVDVVDLKGHLSKERLIAVLNRIAALEENLDDES
jgi:hypothetical protein